ncbi:UNVERIFIED_CONTAM: hypothetical protein FKN15_044275 [Acipenser sinensis]
MREIIRVSLSRELAISGKVLSRELSEMRACLYLNLGFVYDGLKDSQRCSDFTRRSIFIPEVLLNLCDFVAAKRALKKAYTMGSQQPSKRGDIRRSHKYEEALAKESESDAQRIMGMTEQLGDHYCKVGCYRKALDSYQAQHRVFQQLLQQKYSRSWAPLTQTALSPDCRTSVGCRTGVMEEQEEEENSEELEDSDLELSESG